MLLLPTLGPSPSPKPGFLNAVARFGLQAGPIPQKLHNYKRLASWEDFAYFFALDMRTMSAETLAQLITGVGLLLGLLVVAVLVVQRFRGGAAEKGSMAKELAANFQEMRARGDITDADYRRIQSVLGDSLHSELKDGKNKA
jgi:uncharacterized membrane protein